VTRYPSLEPLVAALATCATLLGACGRADPTTSDAPSEGRPEGTQPIPRSLPPLELRDDTPDLLLTWIDAQGDFHVVQTIADVPADARDRVRVVVTTRREGTQDLLYVADLSKKLENGSYPVATLARSEWDAIGAEKRRKRLEALAPDIPRPERPPDEPRAAPDGSLTAVIYGADWCQPCHQAEHLLQKLGVQVVKKDIEESPEAHQEMQRLLRQAGRSGGSIPVIDLGGKLFVGFDARALTQAVAKASKTETL
jgi:glutaredoxin